MRSIDDARKENEVLMRVQQEIMERIHGAIRCIYMDFSNLVTIDNARIGYWF